MPQHDQPDRTHLDARLTELESLFTHLHRTVETLDQVVTEQYRRLDELQRDLQRLKHLTEVLAAKEQEESAERDPGEEKPPHY